MGKQAGKTSVQPSGKKELRKLIEAKISSGIEEVGQETGNVADVKKLIRKASKAISAKLWKKSKTGEKPDTDSKPTALPLTIPAKSAKKAPPKKAVKAAKSSTRKKTAVKSPAKKAAVKKSRPSKKAAVKTASK
jgi:hypothetical protein